MNVLNPNSARWSSQTTTVLMRPVSSSCQQHPALREQVPLQRLLGRVAVPVRPVLLESDLSSVQQRRQRQVVDEAQSGGRRAVAAQRLEYHCLRLQLALAVI